MNNPFSHQLADLQRVASRARSGRTPNNQPNRDLRSRDHLSNSNSVVSHGCDEIRDGRQLSKRSHTESSHRLERDGFNQKRRIVDEGKDRMGVLDGRDIGRRRGHKQSDIFSRNTYRDDTRYAQVPLSDLISVAREQCSKDIAHNGAADRIEGTTKRRHIALLFLTIDDLPHEHIWKKWLNCYSPSRKDANNANDDILGNNEGRYSTAMTSCDSYSKVAVSIICHAKYPERIKSKWLRQRHLSQYSNSNAIDSFGSKKYDGCGKSTEDKERKNRTPPKFHSHRPEWGSIEITRAMIDLLEEGLRIGKKDNETSAQHRGTKCEINVGDLNFDKVASYRRYLSTPDDSFPESDLEDEVKDPWRKPSTSVLSDSDIPSVDRFIFVSESCLPVATLEEVELALFGPWNSEHKMESNLERDGTYTGESTVKNYYNKSWLNAISTPNNGYSKQFQWDKIRPVDIPPNLVWKADQWIVLNRAHSEAIISLPEDHLHGRSLWPAFRKCRASDEMYFATALSILGIIARPTGVNDVTNASKSHGSVGDQICRRKVTFCDWSVSQKNPASFTSADWREVVSKARAEGCLFARKFVSCTSLQGRESDTLMQNNGILSVQDWISTIQVNSF